MDKRAGRRNSNATGLGGNPGHGLAGPLASLASMSADVLRVAEQTRADVKENRDENTKAHSHLHTRIDGAFKDINKLQVTCARLEERSEK